MISESHQQNGVGNMWVVDVLKSRRAIHNYIPNKKIPREDFEKIFDTVRYTPSWYNAQPWEFVVIEDEEKKKELQKIAFNQSHVSQASAVICVLGDVNIWRNAEKILKEWVEYWYCKEEKVLAYRNAFTKKRSEQRLREMAIRNVSLACMNILLVAKELWFATCPMLWFNQPSLSDFLELPKEIIPIMMITIWYENTWKERKKLPLKSLDEILHFEKFEKYKNKTAF